MDTPNKPDEATRAHGGAAVARARAQLAELLERVMADGIVDAAEREQLQQVFRQAVLTVSDVREVFGRYLRGLQNEVLADGHVSEDERRKVRTAVAVLKIPPAFLPPALRAILLG